MIHETLITTVNAQGVAHIAPMGVRIEDGHYVIQPVKPNLTLNNMLETQAAVINYCDDVRIFVGTLTGRRDWPLLPAQQVNGYFLADTLTHTELKLVHIKDDVMRPQVFCKAVHSVIHKPFLGFNRAQFSVLEAAILISRIDSLPWKQVKTELDYLRTGLDKTAGDRERQAWTWLMQAVERYRVYKSR
ncbi:DUF447 family protein [Methylomonas paludis]|uniref:DUF447 family protein n=1 Tax=Methylomonas paludis TaxID=1173101 RepID=A0A975ML52_9GAMM|nr:DUF447 domain-containing protein [Methylomonas paludis]QWF69540.1 DUF447 family protein [Methylomonas paludis]